MPAVVWTVVVVALLCAVAATVAVYRIINPPWITLEGKNLARRLAQRLGRK